MLYLHSTVSWKSRFGDSLKHDAICLILIWHVISGTLRQIIRNCKERGTESTNNTGRPSSRCIYYFHIALSAFCQSSTKTISANVLRSNNKSRCIHYFWLNRPSTSGNANYARLTARSICAHLKFLAPNREPLDVSESLPLRKRYCDWFFPVTPQDAPVPVLVRDPEALLAGCSRGASQKVSG